MQGGGSSMERRNEAKRNRLTSTDGDTLVNPVGALPVADADDFDHEVIGKNVVNDAIVPDAYAVGVLTADEFPAPMRGWDQGKGFNG